MEGAPWRLALVVVMQYSEGRTDCQAAAAVRRCIAWRYALSLDCHDPGLDFTLWHALRARVRAHDATQRLLAPFLATCTARGWSKARGPQRTDATHVLAAMRTLHRLARVRATLPVALAHRRAADAAWVRQQVPVAWSERYGPRAASGRLPKDASQRAARAVPIGTAGDARMARVFGQAAARPLRPLPALAVLRQMGLQPSERCGKPGLEAVRWRSPDERPPAALQLLSPDDLEARYRPTRDTQGVGDKAQPSEPCADGEPDLRTQAITPRATPPDCVMGPALQQA